MPSSFFGLNVAYTGLNAAQASINTTANNISNVQTKGYSKQKVYVSAAASLRAYQRFGSTGTGVSVDSVKQIRDEYYDTKFWNNQAGLGLYEKKLYYMEQIQNYYTDGSLSATTNAGFTTIFSKMFNSLDNLKTKAGDSAARNEFISDAQKLCTYFNSTAQRMQDLQSSINDEIKTTVDNINAISQKIALLNKQINIIEMEKGYANELRDTRAVLIDELSKIAPVEVNERQVVNSNYQDQVTGATYYTVKINGQLLVDNYDYNALACKAREEKYNQSDIDGLYDIVWGATGATFDATAASMGGELKAMFEVRDGNNNENLQGKIVDVTATSFTVTNTNITDVDFMNMPSRGTIWCNNTEYTYTSFTCETDDKGNITSYTFQLDKPIGADEQSKLRNRPMVVGDCVDYMGIPYYMNQMNTFLRSFAEAFNKLQQTGIDADGNPMGSFFVAQYASSTDEYDMTDVISDRKDDTGTGNKQLSSGDNFYYQLTAVNVAVAKKTQQDPDIFATQSKKVNDDGSEITNGVDTHDLIDLMAKLQSREELFRGGGADTFLQCIYADITVDTQECEIFTDNYTNISTTIDNQRQSVSGVDEDEEALDLIKFQNAYNLASKCISVLSEMYDQLILRTGV